MNINIKFNKFSLVPWFESGGGFDGGMRSEKKMTFDFAVINWLGLSFEFEYNFKEHK